MVNERLTTILTSSGRALCLPKPLRRDGEPDADKYLRSSQFGAPAETTTQSCFSPRTVSILRMALALQEVIRRSAWSAVRSSVRPVHEVGPACWPWRSPRTRSHSAHQAM